MSLICVLLHLILLRFDTMNTIRNNVIDGIAMAHHGLVLTMNEVHSLYKDFAGHFSSNVDPSCGNNAKCT